VPVNVDIIPKRITSGSLQVPRLFVGLFAIALALLGQPAQAQAYPSKPIHIVLEFTPGGGGDFLARLFAEEFSTTFGWTVIVENKPGATGTIAHQYVASAPADGHMLEMSAAGPIVINPWLYGKSTVDPMRDFVAIAGVGQSDFILVVRPTLPVHTLAELTALAKSKPGELNFGSPGAGGSLHLAAELYKSMAGVNAVHIPYKGMAPAIAGLLAGDFDFMFADVGIAAPFMRSGQLRGIASTGMKRSPLFPDLPTLDESGLKGYSAGTWYALHGSNKIPSAIVEKLNHAVRTILAKPDVRQKLITAGLTPLDTTTAQMTALQQADYEKWGKLIRSAGIKVD
jgi:tripartite-type tricarboxylate transporter receptor subunit TctC